MTKLVSKLIGNETLFQDLETGRFYRPMEGFIVEKDDNFVPESFSHLFEKQLSELSPQAQIGLLRQFFINMMDWTEQSDMENIYIRLATKLEELEEVLQAGAKE